MKEKLVVVGNGMAGMRTLEELLKLAPDKYDITVFGAEPHGNYNRILLSPVLSGEKTFEEIMLNAGALVRRERHHAAQGQAGRDDRPAPARGRSRTTARSADYDRLLLATGSNPFILPVPGHDLPGVIGFRDIARRRRA